MAVSLGMKAVSVEDLISICVELAMAEVLYVGGYSVGEVTSVSLVDGLMDEETEYVDLV